MSNKCKKERVCFWIVRKLQEMCQKETRPAVAARLNVSAGTLDKYLSHAAPQRIDLEKFKSLYTEQPDFPSLLLCGEKDEGGDGGLRVEFCAQGIGFSAKAEMLCFLQAYALEYAHRIDDLFFVVSRHPYERGWGFDKGDPEILKKSEVLSNLESSEMPGAGELLGIFAQLSKYRYPAADYAPIYAQLYAVRRYSGELQCIDSYPEPGQGRNARNDSEVSYFTIRRNAEMCALPYGMDVIECAPKSPFCRIVDKDDAEEKMDMLSDKWKAAYPKQTPPLTGEFHVIVINPETGVSELWDAFVPAEKLAESKAAANARFPDSICVAESTEHFPNPQDAVWENFGVMGASLGEKQWLARP